MSTLSLRVTGTDNLITGFNKFSTTLVPVTRESAYHALELASAESPGYLGGGSYIAPEVGYIRTGNLGRSLLLEQEGLSARMSVQAYSEKGYEYGHLVLGDASGSGQRGYNAHWIKLRVAVDKQIEALTRAGGLLDHDISKSIKDAGL
jgi:hypothetical protein